VSDPRDGLTREPPPLAPDDPLARKVTEVIRCGDAVELQRLLVEHPLMARVRIGDPKGGQSRTLLHVVTDWPGHVPEAGAKIEALVAAGADVDARFTGPHGETPLHWAASSDDVEAVVALLDAGADIDAPGAVIGGGTPLNDATAFGQWGAARVLVERGAVVSAWDAAALGMTDRVAELLHEDAVDSLGALLWAACHGGHLETAVLLLEAGADMNWLGWDALTPLGAAERAGAVDLVGWLREHGAVDQPG